ncbi:hypothetical protein BDZ91DRAFT_408027 [Kalaharituber pfeilii]|nr:hypothetical protein BDZ91DRAFT_408027 [Kalaharituber pfeilii]
MSGYYNIDNFIFFPEYYAFGKCFFGVVLFIHFPVSLLFFICCFVFLFQRRGTCQSRTGRCCFSSDMGTVSFFIYYFLLMALSFVFVFVGLNRWHRLCRGFS